MRECYDHIKSILISRATHTKGNTMNQKKAAILTIVLTAVIYVAEKVACLGLNMCFDVDEAAIATTVVDVID